MFVDQVKVYVKGGDGGDGMVAFRREKYVAMGGPAGGDGGKGASVIFKVDEGLRTLMDFRYQRHFKATRGEHGMSKGKHGKGADDMIVKVPPGTVVTDVNTGEIIADLVENGQEAMIARGGRGGRGRGGRVSSGGGFSGNRSEAAPAIADTAQFPSLGGK